VTRLSPVDQRRLLAVVWAFGESSSSGRLPGSALHALGQRQILSTVRKHLENAYAQLGVHTRTAAVAALSGLRR
jgi:hypothetical protein